MRTAIDTNILLDVFIPDPVHGPQSLAALEGAYRRGDLIICMTVYAELAPQFADKTMLDDALAIMGVEVLPLSRAAAYEAGKLWRKYRETNKSRDRIITDFLIGAFAGFEADQFLTRDRGFYRAYFKKLKLA